MCGILGVACDLGVNNELVSWALEASSILKHRGPDDEGILLPENEKICFAHRRLSIIDLSSSGRQPLVSHSDKFAIVFNGEIYNHLEVRSRLQKIGFNNWRGTSDTETLLASIEILGLDQTLELIIGMYSFAIYDKSKNILNLVRDRSGEKPLFYAFIKNKLFFASELKALLQIPNLSKNINPVALDCYLYMGYVPGEMCIINGFNKVKASTYITYNLENNNISVTKYWEQPRLKSNQEAFPKNTDYLIEKLEFHLRNAVSAQLLSDVPIGFLLSGGLDSSLITAFAAQETNDVNTFTISMEGHKNFDEAGYAKLISDYYGTNHTVLEVKPDIVNNIYLLAKQFDEPLNDSSMFPAFLVSKMISKHCKVAIGGDGADELFGGYHHYGRLYKLNKISNFVPGLLRDFLSKNVANNLPYGFKGRNWLQALGNDFKKNIPLIATYFDAKSRHLLCKNFGNNMYSAEKIFLDLQPKGVDIVDQAMRYDFSNYLTEDILVKMDRAAMINSLENRSPFLDKNLVEFAFSEIPSSLKSNGRESKIILKMLGKKYLPPSFEYNRKQGFMIPLVEWLKNGPFRDLAFDTLTSTNCPFNKDVILELFRKNDNGYNNAERIFGLTIFEIWRQEYNLNI